MTTHATHHADLAGTPEPAPHVSAECRDVPSDWRWTHNYVCSCGEIVSESWWERHQQRAHNHKEETT